MLKEVYFPQSFKASPHTTDDPATGIHVCDEAVAILKTPEE